MQTYEYSVQHEKNDSGNSTTGTQIDMLNEMAEDGWELLAVLPVSEGKSARFYFRKPKKVVKKAGAIRLG